MLEKAANRIKMQKYGFINPGDITTLDFQLSFAKNIEEEENIKEEDR